MKTFRAALAATALLLTAPFAGAQNTTLTPEIKARVLDQTTQLVTERAYVPGVDFTKWSEYLAAKKKDIDDAKTDEEFASAVQDALSKFSFSHLYLHTPAAAKARVTNQTIGIGIRINPQPDGVLVVGLIPDAPAMKAGIEIGDLIIEADGKKVTGPGQIQGTEGTKVVIKVKKSDGKTKEYTITRTKFSTVRPEELSWADKDTAVLKIYTFDLAYDSDRVEDLIKQASPAKRLIVDLRGNPGGAVFNLMHFLGTVLPDQTTLGTFVDRKLVDTYVKEKHGDPKDLKAMAEWSPNKIHIRANKKAHFDGEIAVLVDGGSGSAAEMAAEALKEVSNAPVVGTKSAGAVLVSVMRPITDGYVLQMPITDYISVKGVRLEGNGVTPDKAIDPKKFPLFLKKGEKDPIWADAIALLKKAESTAKAGAGSSH